jgi:DNA repair exonuclease SbcCD ATPase subunit
MGRGADAFDSGPASFLSKAMPIAAGATVTLKWTERTTGDIRVVGEEPEELAYPCVRYLSQHFVEQLCSSEGASDRLIEEVEKVVFDALDETDRSQASSFSELRRIATEASEERIQELRGEIAEWSHRIGQELAERTHLPKKRELLKSLDAELLGITKSLGALVIKGKEDKRKALEGLQAEHDKLEKIVSDLKSKQRRLSELRLNLEQRERLELQSFEDLREELRTLGIPDAESDAFRFSFAGDFRAVLSKYQQTVVKDISSYSAGSQPPTGFSGTLTLLRTKIEALQKDIGVEAGKERQLLELQKKLKSKQLERQNLDTEIARASSADARIREAQKKRLDRYLDVFAELKRQREELERLYQPLADMLSEAPPERKKLEFFVRQVVNTNEWAERGEQLLDLRRKGGFFREQGGLAKKADEILGKAWRSGNEDLLRASMLEFLELFKDASKFLVPTATLAQFADWLFSTEHVGVTYGIRYEGTDIERLSPGTRGIVLLILYLALDTQDDRPLIIDQPEENLDPQSVYDVLSGYFREVRSRRQVFLVTHNPNLVVNTDADQVLIASAQRIAGETLPRFTYQAGGLENPLIRKRVCQVLEGGERAFLDRERRYRLLQAELQN